MAPFHPYVVPYIWETVTSEHGARQIEGSGTDTKRGFSETDSKVGNAKSRCLTFHASRPHIADMSM